MKSTLIRNNQPDTKQRVNELVNPGENSQSVTLYNADSTDFLSQKSRSLHTLLQKINEIEFFVETAGLCLRPIQDLLNTSKTLLQNFSTAPDPEIWTTYAGLFAEFTNQIEQITLEASFENKNLLHGDTLSLEFDDSDSYNFQVKGKDLTPLLQTLKELSSEEPQSTEQLHHAYNQLENVDRSINALGVILQGTEAVLKSKKVFTQKLLKQTISKMNALKYAASENYQSDTPRFQSLTQMIDRTHYLPNASGIVTEHYEFAEDNIYSFSDTMEADKSAQNLIENNKNPFSTHQADPETEVIAHKEPPYADTTTEIEEETDRGFSSLFPLFRSGRKEKNKNPQGIRTILDRLHISENPETIETQQKNVEPTPIKQPTDLDKLCLELLFHLDGKQIAFLEKRFHNGETQIYAEALGQFVTENKDVLNQKYKTEEKLQQLMTRFEQTFHQLVKENYKKNPENRDKFIQEWLKSPYGSVYKVIFPILKNKTKTND